MCSSILTGSSEFWATGARDTDYIVFRPQETIFEYVKDKAHNTCNFCYRDDLTKEQYFAWHAAGNGWYLNFAPLITAGFLARMGIDIFGADRDAVFGIFRKAFNYCYRALPPSRWNKYAYRLYIYYCYMCNGSLILTETQLDTALRFKQRKAVDATITSSLYDFFGKNIKKE